MKCWNDLQDPKIVDVKNVLTLDMCFESAEDALIFYVKYVQLASFNMRKNIKRNNYHAQELECSFSRTYKGGPGQDRTCGKTTKKTNAKQWCASQDQQ
jgi:hypothetical protein